MEPFAVTMMTNGIPFQLKYFLLLLTWRRQKSHLVSDLSEGGQSSTRFNTALGSYAFAKTLCLYGQVELV